MSFRGISHYQIKELAADQAVEQGADLIGEIIIFSVAIAVASFEYQRSSMKAKEKERVESELKQAREEELDRRLEHLESQMLFLEKQLVHFVRILDKDLDSRIHSESAK